jgi:hypothetical protein
VVQRVDERTIESFDAAEAVEGASDEDDDV